MNPMQIMAMLQNSGNPMMMLTQLAQQNPMMSRAMQMGQGKNEAQLKETDNNAALQVQATAAGTISNVSLSVVKMA